MSRWAELGILPVPGSNTEECLWSVGKGLVFFSCRGLLFVSCQGLVFFGCRGCSSLAVRLWA